MTKLDDRHAQSWEKKMNDASALPTMFFLTYRLTACRIAQKDNYSFSIDVKNFRDFCQLAALCAVEK